MRDSPDIVQELAPLLRVRPELRELCLFGPQFAAAHAAEALGWAPFHIVTQGACLLDVGDRKGVRLEVGDVAVLPHGGQHQILAVTEGPGAPVCSITRPQDGLVIKSNVAGDPDTKLICGRVRFEQAQDNLLLAALPSLVILSTGGGRDAPLARTLVDLIRDELDDDRLGSAAIAAAMASALMMLVLRAYFESEPEGHNVLALLAGRQTAKALHAMLADIARDWSLDELAEQAGASRATLVRLFQKAVQTPPLGFLTDLRLSLARARLLASKAPLAAIAEDVGYQSETAFSRAYHRRFGLPPGEDRTKAVR